MSSSSRCVHPSDSIELDRLRPTLESGDCMRTPSAEDRLSSSEKVVRSEPVSRFTVMDLGSDFVSLRFSPVGGAIVAVRTAIAMPCRKLERKGEEQTYGM